MENSRILYTLATLFATSLLALPYYTPTVNASPGLPILRCLVTSDPFVPAQFLNGRGITFVPSAKSYFVTYTGFGGDFSIIHNINPTCGHISDSRVTCSPSTIGALACPTPPAPFYPNERANGVIQWDPATKTFYTGAYDGSGIISQISTKNSVKVTCNVSKIADFTALGETGFVGFIDGLAIDNTSTPPSIYFGWDEGNIIYHITKPTPKFPVCSLLDFSKLPVAFLGRTGLVLSPVNSNFLYTTQLSFFFASPPNTFLLKVNKLTNQIVLNETLGKDLFGGPNVAEGLTALTAAQVFSLYGICIPGAPSPCPPSPVVDIGIVTNEASGGTPTISVYDVP